MNLELSGAKVAIAGASKGIGFGIARAFAEEGAQVWISGRNRENLEKAAQKLNGAQSTECDLETSSGREKFADEVKKKWGSLDTLILNLGSGRATKSGTDTSDEEWQRVFNLNFFSAAGLLRVFRPLLEQSKNASVVAISSIAGETRLQAPISYSTAKAALNQFCVVSAAELAAKNIRFNTIAPGNILAPGGRWEELLAKDPAQVHCYIQNAVPMKRFGNVDEVAAFAVFLASKRASFCTGSVIRVDGGQAPNV